MAMRRRVGFDLRTLPALRLELGDDWGFWPLATIGAVVEDDIADGVAGFVDDLGQSGAKAFSGWIGSPPWRRVRMTRLSAKGAIPAEGLSVCGGGGSWAGRQTRRWMSRGPTRLPSRRFQSLTNPDRGFRTPGEREPETTAPSGIRPASLRSPHRVQLTPSRQGEMLGNTEGTGRFHPGGQSPVPTVGVRRRPRRRP